MLVCLAAPGSVVIPLSTRALALTAIVMSCAVVVLLPSIYRLGFIGGYDEGYDEGFSTACTGANGAVLDSGQCEIVAPFCTEPPTCPRCPEVCP